MIENADTFNISSKEVIETRGETIIYSIGRLEERLKQLHEEVEKIYQQLIPLLIPIVRNEFGAEVDTETSPLKARLDRCDQLLKNEIEQIQSIRHGLDL